MRSNTIFFSRLGTFLNLRGLVRCEKLVEGGEMFLEREKQVVKSLITVCEPQGTFMSDINLSFKFLGNVVGL